MHNLYRKEEKKIVPVSEFDEFIVSRVARGWSK